MHQPARHGAGADTAEIVQAYDQRGGRQREADGVEHGRRPERDRHQHHERHEERDPQQQGRHCAAFREQLRDRRALPRRVGRGDERGVGGDRARHDAFERAPDLVEADVARDQETDGLRQPDGQHRRDHQRRDRADIEHRPPAEGRDDPGAGERADEAAGWEGGEQHGHEHVPQPLGRELGAHREEGGRRAAQAEAREEAIGEQFLE